VGQRQTLLHGREINDFMKSPRETVTTLND